MQAIIMAAGKGSRLADLTNGQPKSFVELKGRKLIEYNLTILDKCGVDEIIIVTGYGDEAFKDLLKGREHIKLVYNPFYESVNVLGSFFMGMNELHDDFIYLHADTLCDPVIFDKLVGFEHDITLPVDFKKCDEEAMKIRTQNGKVTEISKLIPLDQAQGEFIGIASFRKKIIPDLRMKTTQLMREKAFTSYFEGAVQRLIDEEDYDIGLIPMEGAFWAEIDFKEDYERAELEIPVSMIEM